MKSLVPLFSTDPITKWAELRGKTWESAESHYERLLKELRMSALSHLVYLCAPLKPTKQRRVQDHVAEAIGAASQILGGVIAHNGKKIAVWIPHVHLFSIYNEIVYPEAREKAIKFNNYIIERYFHTLVVVGDTISGGMAAEIELAKKTKIEIIKIGSFKKQLRNLPSFQKAKESCQKMISLHNKIHGPKFLIEQ